jgi:ATP synthase protein I
MNDEKKTKIANEEFSRQVGAQARRKLKAQRRPKKSIWFGLGVSGLIGWSVTAPTLIGAALGIWIDAHHPSKISWTLTLLFLGLGIGCLNAWHWVVKEDQAMQEDQRDGDA